MLILPLQATKQTNQSLFESLICQVSLVSQVCTCQPTAPNSTPHLAVRYWDRSLVCSSVWYAQSQCLSGDRAMCTDHLLSLWPNKCRSACSCSQDGDSELARIKRQKRYRWATPRHTSESCFQVTRHSIGRHTRCDAVYCCRNITCSLPVQYHRCSCTLIDRRQHIVIWTERVMERERI